MKKMNRFFMFLWVGVIVPLGTWAQVGVTPVPTLEIHQIDVADGDATFIKVNAVGRTYAILIDAGIPTYAPAVRNYIWGPDNNNMPSANPYLDLVIVSHYDNDHLGGISTNSDSYFGILEWYEIEPPSTKPTNFKIDIYATMDPGREPGPKYAVGTMAPPPAYQAYDEQAGGLRQPIGLPTCNTENLTIPARDNAGKYPHVANADLKLGGAINLGSDANGIPIRMRLVASNAYVLRPTDENRYAYYDALPKNKSRDSMQTSTDNNNFCLAWVIEYGQFRYYTGGDLSGVNEGGLFDVESELALGMPKILPEPAAIQGHVCAMKANHHGSKHSSNTNFIKMLKPSLVGFSCGSIFDFPHNAVIENFEKTRWSSPYLHYTQNAAYVITRLYNGREIPTDRLLISGCKGVVKDSEVPDEIIIKGKGTKRKREVIHSDYSYEVPGAEVPLGMNFQLDGLGQPLAKKSKIANGTDKDVLLKFASDQFVPNVDGDFKIIVYPNNSKGESITAVSSYQLARRQPTSYDWTAWVEYICHVSTLIAPPSTSTSK